MDWKMKKIVIHSQDRLRFVAPHEIMVCKSDNCYTSLYLVNGEEVIMCKSLTKIAKELDSFLFVRVNQSYLVNRDFIKSVDKKKKIIELDNDRQIPFSISIRELLNLVGQSA
jgi:DNA-binding LytR/AlgR family response regulator